MVLSWQWVVFVSHYGQKSWIEMGMPPLSPQTISAVYEAQLCRRVREEEATARRRKQQELQQMAAKDKRASRCSRSERRDILIKSDIESISV
jgi:hypothetical protein